MPTVKELHELHDTINTCRARSSNFVSVYLGPNEVEVHVLTSNRRQAQAQDMGRSALQANGNTDVRAAMHI